jgi:hypothetical protein
MLFALALGAMFGAAGVVLVQQWLRGTLSGTGIASGARASAVLHGDRFPRLAPPTRTLR